MSMPGALGTNTPEPPFWAATGDEILGLLPLIRNTILRDFVYEIGKVWLEMDSCAVTSQRVVALSIRNAMHLFLIINDAYGGMKRSIVVKVIVYPKYSNNYLFVYCFMYLYKIDIAALFYEPCSYNLKKRILECSMPSFEATIILGKT